MTSDSAGPCGTWIYELGLSWAVTREILAGIEIDVLETRAPSPSPSSSCPRTGCGADARRSCRPALLEHAARHNLKTS